MTDEFEGIFDDLSPEDFNRESSARSIKTVKKPKSFDDFVQHWLDATRLAFHAADGRMDPTAVMMDSNSRRIIFSPDDDETLGQYIDRLQREARTLGATWFFTTVLTQGGTYQTDEGRIIGDPEALEEAREQDALKPCIYWYAERRDGANDEIRHGIIGIDAGDTGEVFEAPSEHASPIYRKVLDK